MKEMYFAPKCEMFALAADAHLANGVVDFDEVMEKFQEGISAMPEVDIDVPIS